MPPLIAAVLVGAGFYAGMRILSRALVHLGDGAAAARADAQSGVETVVVEKDLGALEWDPTTGVYRPLHRKAD
jgi:hypothetical protein